MADLLTDEEVDDRAPEGWHHEDAEIVRTYEFDEYLDGAEFASEAAEIADEEFHHPEITIRYGEVAISLTSHEEGGVTDQDVRMAERFDDAR